MFKFYPISQKKWFCLPALLAGSALFLSACNPTVRVEAPDKPITINLNVKIDHEIRLRVEKDIDELLSEESGLF